MKPKVEYTPDGTALISGELIFKYRYELLEILKDVYKVGSTTIVSAPMQIDLCYVQLVLSLSLIQKQGGKPVALQLRVNDSDKQLLERTGFANLLNTQTLKN
jgi:hypothetical protein